MIASILVLLLLNPAAAMNSIMRKHQEADTSFYIVDRGIQVKLAEPGQATQAGNHTQYPTATVHMMEKIQAKSLYDEEDRHCPNQPKKRYELLRDFTKYMTQYPHLRWSLGFGSLLGAMRQVPPGFIPQDDDLDLYMPARDLAELHDAMKRDASDNVTRMGILKNAYENSCCSFGWRLMHRDDDCAYMDFFALVSHDRKWLFLGGGMFPTGEAHVSKDEYATHCPNALMRDKERFKENPSKTGSGAREWSWGGDDMCLHHSAYKKFNISEDEFSPLQQKRMYGLTVNVPNHPWAILNRRYGKGAADHDDDGHDLNKDPKWRKPADVGLDV